MPPDRGRASKACTACRKQKTRCYESAAGKACLRCERLGQVCSLNEETLVVGNGGVAREDGDGAENERRFQRLERLVDTLYQRMEDLEASTPLQRARHGVDQSPPHAIERIQPDSDTVSNEQAPAPLFVLRDVAAESGLRVGERTATATPSRAISDDIISKGLLSEQDAVSLLALFQEQYGSWVSFDPEIPPNILLDDIRKSPLLLTACCLIAVRHTTQEVASRLAPKLSHEARALLSAAMLTIPQPTEFFQASLILSLWSTTIGQGSSAIDSWLLSGFTVQHSIAGNLFPPTSSKAELRKEELDRLCIWNHLCLAHLHYCVGTRRSSMIGRRDIDKCRIIMGSDHATNFESRMVAEVYLYWIIYESFSAYPIDLSKTQAALHAWREEWKFLFDQPRAQFVQMGFHFAQLLLYDQSIKTRSAAARESLLSEMVLLSTAIIDLAMGTTDERTRYLTDHVYHMISFAAVTLCRLLHTYEAQISVIHDLATLDELILSLVSWLHAVGLPCHVAHTMGDVVAAFHKKLRPDTGPSPSTSYADVDPGLQDDYAQLFPELFGASSFNIINGSILPDFRSMY